MIPSDISGVMLNLSSAEQGAWAGSPWGRRSEGAGAIPTLPGPDWGQLPRDLLRSQAPKHEWA